MRDFLMRPLNIGMIGAGFIGQLAHFTSFSEVDNCKLLAVAEYKPKLLKKIATHYNIPRQYVSHTDLIADPEIDAVVVVTPRPLTGPVVLDCLQAGKHVLSEKPMVGNAKQGKILLEAAMNAHVHYAVGYMKRFDAGVEAVKEILTEALQRESLGKILNVHATCYMGNSYCNAFGHIQTEEKSDTLLEEWEMSPSWLPKEFHYIFGSYLNTQSHVTNLLRYIFDDDPSVEFVNMTDFPGQLVILKFKNFLATLETGKMSHYGWSEVITITFTDGEIHLCMPPALLRNVPATVEIYYAGQKQKKENLYFNWSWSFRRQAEAFVSNILNKTPMRNSAEEAYKEILLVESIFEAELKRLGISKNKEKISA
jgi:predicted dehydrogenase